MAKNKSLIFIYVVLLTVALLLALVGASSLWKNGSSVLGFILFGVGLGGLIAGFGEFISDYFPNKSSKDNQ